MMSLNRKLTVLICLILSLAIRVNAFAALGSGMSLSSEGPFTVNDTFTVRISISGYQNFSVADGSIRFPKDKLSVISAAWNPEAAAQFGIQLSDSPSNANASGIVSFVAITNEPSGIDPVVYGNPVFTITFQCIGIGNADIGNSDSSAWTLGDGKLVPDIIKGNYPLRTISITGDSVVASCIPISNDLALNFCAEYSGIKYGCTLNIHDLSELIWKLDISTFRELPSDTGNCISVKDDLKLNMCAAYQGKNYEFTMDFYMYPQNSAELYWKLDVATFREIQ
jgi:hypothetical protein